MAKKKQAQQEEALLEQAYRQVSDKPKKSSGKKRGLTALVICLAAVLLLGGAFCGYLFFVSDVPPGIIMENVSVLGVDVGGMTRDEAAAVLHDAARELYGSSEMSVTVLADTVTISPQAAAVTLDAQAAAQEAYAVGRTGSLAQRKAQQLQALTVGVDVELTSSLHMDTAAIRSELEVLGSKYNTSVIQPGWELTGQVPDLQAKEEPAQHQALVITKGTPGYELDMEGLLEHVLQAYRARTFQSEYACQVTEPDAMDLEALHKQYTLEPVDSVMDMETFQATAHTFGYSFDLEQAKQQLEEAADGETVSIPFARVTPKETQEALQELLFRDVLGTYTAYSSSDPYNRDVNLRLSCNAINGTVLMPGEVFSYNPKLGERTEEAGYKKADGYVGNETVQTYGGGICQASSCLYLSAMLADLEIVERTNHTFISSYMPYGMDATVSWGGPEFRFRNSSDYPIRIEAKASGGAVTVKLLGTDTKDYYIKVIYEVLDTQPFKTVYKEMEADNEKGYKDGQQITSGYTGYKIRTYRCKYDKATDELISKDLEVTSTYSRRDRVICKIVEKPAPKPPVETTEPEETTQPVETTQPTETTVPTEETTVPGIGGTAGEDNG